MVGVAKVDSAGEMCQKWRVSLRVKPEMREAFCRTRRLRCRHPRVLGRRGPSLRRKCIGHGVCCEHGWGGGGAGVVGTAGDGRGV